jgi:hypothetical protein
MCRPRTASTSRPSAKQPAGTLTPQGTTVVAGDALITADNGDTLTRGLHDTRTSAGPRRPRDRRRNRHHGRQWTLRRRHGQARINSDRHAVCLQRRDPAAGQRRARKRVDQLLADSNVQQGVSHGRPLASEGIRHRLASRPPRRRHTTATLSQLGASRAGENAPRRMGVRSAQCAGRSSPLDCPPGPWCCGVEAHPTTSA